MHGTSKTEKKRLMYLEAEAVWRERIARIDANYDMVHPTVLTIASDLILKSLELYIGKRKKYI